MRPKKGGPPTGARLVRYAQVGTAPATDRLPSRLLLCPALRLLTQRHACTCGRSCMHMCMQAWRRCPDGGHAFSTHPRCLLCRMRAASRPLSTPAAPPSPRAPEAWLGLAAAHSRLVRRLAVAGSQELATVRELATRLRRAPSRRLASTFLLLARSACRLLRAHAACCVRMHRLCEGLLPAVC